tara:strand:- start:247 stop:477 length:231 start_codon:yes stop_codon:yes gene_type:complete
MNTEFWINQQEQDTIKKMFSSARSIEKILIEKNKEIERLEKLLADADLCNVCGLDYAGYADYDEACKCDEQEMTHE